MQKKKNNISITAFLWITVSFIIFTTAIFGVNTVVRMHQIRAVASDVRQENIPKMDETQRSFINLENLRHLAELVYITDSAKIRRNARIEAHKLSKESIFTQQDDAPAANDEESSSYRFYRLAAHIVDKIGNLAKIRDAEESLLKQSYDTTQELVQSVIAIAVTHQNSPEVKQMESAAFKIFTSLPFSSYAVSHRAGNNEKMFKDNIILFDTIINSAKEISLETENKELFLNLLTYRKQYTEICTSLLSNYKEAFTEWEEIDDKLQEMRDRVRSDGLFDTVKALKVIEEEAIFSVDITTATAVASLAFFVVYVFLFRFLLVRPIKWVGKKLLEIQHGETKTPVPNIYISELYQVGNILDRFSNHLAKLTSQASSDAVERINLEALMEAVFTVNVEGYVTWNLKHGLLFINPMLLQKLGYKNRDEFNADARTIGNIDARRINHEEIFKRVWETGYYREERFLLAANGEEIPFEASYLPLDRADGKWALSSFRDLREQKHVEEVLRAAKDKAEDAAKVKSEFLARMSHEIRTPMNGVLGLTKVALDADPAPAQTMYLKKIQSSARVLLGVINDILDFSKLESVKFELEKRLFSLPNMLSTISNMFNEVSNEKGIELRIETDTSVPEFVIGDELRISQVLLNLCGNALKFTSEGVVELNVHRSALNEETVTLVFDVKDTGIGMTPEQVQRLFQPFSQADMSTTRKYGGTGLGLVISKSLVELMGGSLTVTSNENVGSNFTFDVIFGVSTDVVLEMEIQNNSANLDDSKLDGLRVLLVEDHEINQEIAVALLEQKGCNVTVAGNGKIALDILETGEFDCILMDIQMPVMDGLTATKFIRESEKKYKDLPIIAMTAHAMPEDITKSFEQGMNAHITKPIDSMNLYNTILQVTA